MRFHAMQEIDKFCLIEHRAIYTCRIYGNVWPTLRLTNFAHTEGVPGEIKLTVVPGNKVKLSLCLTN
jgi:hypothetical protein